MEWDNTSGHVVSHGVRVVPCSHGDFYGKWIWYAGGFYVNEPTCLPLVIKIGAHLYRQHVPLGTTCP